MTRILAVSWCCGRGGTAGALFGSGGAVASGVAPTSGPAVDAGGWSPEGVGGAAAGVDGAVGFGVPVISLSGIW
jgi:hypothetical protein